MLGRGVRNVLERVLRGCVKDAFATWVAETEARRAEKENLRRCLTRNASRSGGFCGGIGTRSTRTYRWRSLTSSARRRTPWRMRTRPRVDPECTSDRGFRAPFAPSTPPTRRRVLGLGPGRARTARTCSSRRTPSSRREAARAAGCEKRRGCARGEADVDDVDGEEREAGGCRRGRRRHQG